MVEPKFIFKKITAGLFWLEFIGSDVRIICGCPPDCSKHLLKAGFVHPTEINGVPCQTGPNAILLSDDMVQNGEMTNLIEFPIMQMFYFQGTLLPNHPNNRPDNKPIVMGIREKVEAQMEYTFRGNYGLIEKEDFIASGISPEMAKELLRMKLKFAFGGFYPIDQSIQKMYISSEKQHVRNDIFVQRLGGNKFKVSYKEEDVLVDLNLEEGERFTPTFKFTETNVSEGKFVITDMGCGDGWDPERPCFSSMVTCEGKDYLVDAGPYIARSLSFIGKTINQVSGVFLTHGHDDHIAGLTNLMKKSNKVTLYSTALVRKSIMRKLCGLLQISERGFESVFEIIDLEYECWNQIDESLEVFPFHSPHPVDTAIFMFRAQSEENGTYKIYSHFGDICSFDVLDGMVTDDSQAPGCSREFVEQVKKNYLIPADVKKIDIGGGMIHGNAEDFATDTSSKIILGHTSKPLSSNQLAIGKSVPFGHSSVLIQ